MADNTKELKTLDSSDYLELEKLARERFDKWKGDTPSSGQHKVGDKELRVCAKLSAAIEMFQDRNAKTVTGVENTQEKEKTKASITEIARQVTALEEAAPLRRGVLTNIKSAERGLPEAHIFGLSKILGVPEEWLHDPMRFEVPVGGKEIGRGKISLDINKWHSVDGSVRIKPVTGGKGKKNLTGEFDLSLREMPSGKVCMVVPEQRIVAEVLDNQIERL